MLEVLDLLCLGVYVWYCCGGAGHLYTGEWLRDYILWIKHRCDQSE